MSLPSRGVVSLPRQCSAPPSAPCMLLLPLGFSAPEHILLVYILPLAVAFLAVSLVISRLKRQDSTRLEAELKEARQLAQERERERDLAQEELFRRLYEERELNKEKTQFQAQLTEYEKYAALAQLALGAAHELNNPLLGILTHMELELKQASNGDERDEIKLCIDATRRFSSTHKTIITYAVPGPLLIS